MVRVRFAPSPTGYLHVGGARTALFNKLFVAHTGGKFILRIEDTDLKRSEKKYLDEILEDLTWLGLSWDEGPYYQSQRFALYNASAERLLKEAKAYKEEGAVIFKMPQEPVTVKDLIHGEIKFDPEQFDFKDLVLLKSDGSPTYNFACVVDDADLKVSHIIRGDDHISNTPKQIALYKALGFPLPEFAHIPLILAKDRTKMSKRKGAHPIVYYKEQGYLAPALVNFLALLGWSPGDNREIMPWQTMVKEFSLERINHTAAVFDDEKLDWINKQYLSALSSEDFLRQVQPQLSARYGKDFSVDWLKLVIELFKARATTLNDFVERSDFLFLEEISFAPEAAKLLQDEKTKGYLKAFGEAIEKTEPFNQENLEEAARKVIEALGINNKQLLQPARAALSGKLATPGIFELMLLMGKEKVIKRLSAALNSELKIKESLPDEREA
jgi:glutamyl-tRNA synthetase